MDRGPGSRGGPNPVVNKPYTVVHLANGKTIVSAVPHTFTDMQVEEWKESMVAVLTAEKGYIQVDTDDGMMIVASRWVTHVEVIYRND